MEKFWLRSFTVWERHVLPRQILIFYNPQDCSPAFFSPLMRILNPIWGGLNLSILEFQGPSGCMKF